MYKKTMNYIFFGIIIALSVVTFLTLLVIVAFVLSKGLPNISLEFLIEAPSKMGKEGGIFPILVGTILVTIVAISIATPLGVFAAIYFNEYSKKSKWVKLIRFFTEILAGIPSIIFGLFGFAFFVVFLGIGWSILSGALTLSIMILPTLIRSTEEALKTVPASYREGSLSLGASKWQTIYKVILPCCKTGVFTGLILGIGRAIGETAAVMLTIGGSLRMANDIFDPTRTLALHLYTLASEGLSEEKTYATSALLIILVLLINTIANKISSLKSH